MDWGRISVVATDLDGTLLRSDKSVSDRTRARLEAAAAADLTVIVVTARPPRWLADIEGLHLHGYAIVANGAVVVDLDTGRHLETITLDADTVVEVSSTIRAGHPEVAFAIESRDGFAHEPGYVSDWPIAPGTPVGHIDELVVLGSDPVKLLARQQGLGDHSIAMLQAVVGDRCTISYSGGTGLIEIGPPGVDKGRALARLVASLDIDREAVVAVGDMPNDLPMLQWAGHAAAVANAHADLLAIADTVLPSNDDDGVGHLIELVLAGRAGR